MKTLKHYDGEVLWNIRSRCMLDSKTLSAANECNRQNHPTWPAPKRDKTESPPDVPTAPPPTSLCEAIGTNDSGTLRKFISESKVLCRNGFEGTNALPLHMASLVGDVAAVRLLIEHGASPLETDPRGRTAIIFAAMGNHPEVIDLYWSIDARPTKNDPHIGTLLWSAGLNGRLPILQHYKQLGADMNASHVGGWTALMAAAQSGHLEIVTWLVADARVDLSRRNGAGLTALDIAKSRDRSDVVRYLSKIPQ